MNRTQAKEWRQLFNTKTGEAAFVVAHARLQKQKGRHPSLPYRGVRNPRRALLLAIEDLKTYVPSAGEDIYYSSVIASRVAALSGNDVVFKFNDVIMTAKPGSKPGDLFKYWQEESDRQHEEWLASPEGRKYTFDMELKLRRKQRKADRLMASLPKVDLSDLWLAILWLKEYEDAAGWRAVEKTPAKVVEVFLSHGYLPDSNLDCDPGEKEDFGRWLIGQALVCLQKYGSIHQMYRRFAEEWREAFYPTKNSGRNFSAFEIGEAIGLITGFHAAAVRSLDGIADFMNHLLGVKAFDPLTLSIADRGNGRLEFKNLPAGLYRAALKCRLILMREKPNLYRYVSGRIEEIESRLSVLVCTGDRESEVFDWATEISGSYGPTPIMI